MKIGIVSPYGMLSPESTHLAMLGCYLKFKGHEVFSVLCDGAFSQCMRDSEGDGSGSNRDFGSCLNCFSEQTRLANWSGSEVVRLNKFIHPESYLRLSLAKIAEGAAVGLVRHYNIAKLFVAAVNNANSNEEDFIAAAFKNTDAEYIAAKFDINNCAMTFRYSSTGQTKLLTGEIIDLSRTKNDPRAWPGEVLAKYEGII